MQQVCPRACGRLATAAVLISVGVVQLVAGLILVRSKYVYLLSAPNFWTAASNLAVGGMLGISASVWKETQKASPKHTTRRNLLASLVLSSLLLNGTTATILVLGEGNALLSIRLENSGVYSNETFASELLAYAFATSVCSPIVCIVVACIFLSGLCFHRLEKNAETIKNKNILNDDNAYAYSWVFRPKLGRLPHPNPTIIRRALSTRYLSSSTDDDDSLGSPDSVLHRSNSLPSVDGSLINGTRRKRTQSESNMFQQANHKQNITGFVLMDTPRDRNKVSFVDESLKSGRSLPRHFEISKRSNQDVFKARHNDASFESRNKYPKSARIMQPKLLDNGSPGVEIASDLELDRYKEKTSVVADIHMDIGEFENAKAFVNYNNSAEESTLIYEPDSCSSDVFARFGNDNSPYTKSKIRRTSTERSLKSLEAMNRSEEGRKYVRRTSTTKNSKSPDKFEVMEDSQYDVSSFAQSSIRLPKDLIENAFDIPTTPLAGEMIPIQVSTLPRKLSSKLVSVPIPVVSGTRKYSLKAAESSDNRYHKNKNQNHRRASSVTRTSKFHAVGEPKLLSFRGGIKTKAKVNGSHKAVILPRKQAATPAIDHEVAQEPTPLLETENEDRENGCSSPAHTSGYMSALEDTLDTSGGKSGSTETSIVNPSTSAAGSFFGQTHYQPMPDGWDSQYVRTSVGCNATKELNRIDYKSFGLHSKEKLIDQLLNDPSFQKIMMQSLKETSI